MPEQKSIGIVGLGLIGGSLGLDFQALGWNVAGLVRKNSTAEIALQRGLAQTVSTDPKVLSKCDLIIIALPLAQLLQPNADLLAALPENAVVTDVGSVKAPVLSAWRGVHPRFVASHPMAGTEKTGVEAGKKGLFLGKPWISTPEQNTDPEALEIVHQTANSLGSKWFTTEAEKHDQAVALISHLPVFVSAALLKTLGNERDPYLRELAQSIASSGFADTTRIGGGNPELGASMAANNTSAILKTLSNYRWNLEEIEQAILSENWQQLKAELEETKDLRGNCF